MNRSRKFLCLGYLNFLHISNVKLTDYISNQEHFKIVRCLTTAKSLLQRMLKQAQDVAIAPKKKCPRERLLFFGDRQIRET